MHPLARARLGGGGSGPHTFDTFPPGRQKVGFTAGQANKLHAHALMHEAKVQEQRLKEIGEIDIFLSHNWGRDDCDRDNHARVVAVNKLLKKKVGSPDFVSPIHLGHPPGRPFLFFCLAMPPIRPVPVCSSHLLRHIGGGDAVGGFQ